VTTDTDRNNDAENQLCHHRNKLQFTIYKKIESSYLKIVIIVKEKPLLKTLNNLKDAKLWNSTVC